LFLSDLQLANKTTATNKIILKNFFTSIMYIGFLSLNVRRTITVISPS